MVMFWRSHRPWKYGCSYSYLVLCELFFCSLLSFLNCWCEASSVVLCRPFIFEWSAVCGGGADHSASVVSTVYPQANVESRVARYILVWSSQVSVVTVFGREGRNTALARLAKATHKLMLQVTLFLLMYAEKKVPTPLIQNIFMGKNSLTNCYISTTCWTTACIGDYNVALIIIKLHTLKLLPCYF